VASATATGSADGSRIHEPFEMFKPGAQTNDSEGDWLAVRLCEPERESVIVAVTVAELLSVGGSEALAEFDAEPEDDRGVSTLPDGTGERDRDVELDAL
jgi:hypothetical protein